MDQATEDDLRKISELYYKYELKEKPKDVGRGFWVPTNFPVLLAEMKLFHIITYIEKKEHKGMVLVAGSGDGRRAAYLNRLGYDVTCVETNPKLVEHSNYLMQLLAQEGLIEANRLSIIEGDFLDDKIYNSGGSSFEDFTKIFARLLPHNLNSLAHKIEAQSRPGTDLFSLQSNLFPPSLAEFPDQEINLKHVYTATLRTFANHTLSLYKKI